MRRWTRRPRELIGLGLLVAPLLFFAARPSYLGDGFRLVRFLSPAGQQGRRAYTDAADLKHRLSRSVRTPIDHPGGQGMRELLDFASDPASRARLEQVRASKMPSPVTTVPLDARHRTADATYGFAGGAVLVFGLGWTLSNLVQLWGEHRHMDEQRSDLDREGGKRPAAKRE